MTSALPQAAPWPEPGGDALSTQLITLMREYDDLGNGTIRSEDLDAVVRNLDLEGKLAGDDLIKALQGVGVAKDGRVDYMAMIKWIFQDAGHTGPGSQWPPVSAMDELLRKLRRRDAAGHGTVSRDALQRVFCATGGLTSEEFSGLLREAGASCRGGLVDYEDFVRWLFRGPNIEEHRGAMLHALRAAMEAESTDVEALKVAVVRAEAAGVEQSEIDAAAALAERQEQRDAAHSRAATVHQHPDVQALRSFREVLQREGRRKGGEDPCDLARGFLVKACGDRMSGHVRSALTEGDYVLAEHRLHEDARALLAG